MKTKHIEKSLDFIFLQSFCWVWIEVSLLLFLLLLGEIYYKGYRQENIFELTNQFWGTHIYLYIAGLFPFLNLYSFLKKHIGLSRLTLSCIFFAVAESISVSFIPLDNTFLNSLLIRSIYLLPPCVILCLTLAIVSIKNDKKQLTD